MPQSTMPVMNYALPDHVLNLLEQYLQEQVTPTIEIDPAQLAYRWLAVNKGTWSRWQ